MTSTFRLLVHHGILLYCFRQYVNWLSLTSEQGFWGVSCPSTWSGQALFFNALCEVLRLTTACELWRLSRRGQSAGWRDEVGCEGTRWCGGEWTEGRCSGRQLCWKSRSAWNRERERGGTIEVVDETACVGSVHGQCVLFSYFIIFIAFIAKFELHLGTQVFLFVCLFYFFIYFLTTYQRSHSCQEKHYFSFLIYLRNCTCPKCLCEYIKNRYYQELRIYGPWTKSIIRKKKNKNPSIQKGFVFFSTKRQVLLAFTYRSLQDYQSSRQWLIVRPLYIFHIQILFKSVNNLYFMLVFKILRCFTLLERSVFLHLPLPNPRPASKHSEEVVVDL